MASCLPLGFLLLVALGQAVASPLAVLFGLVAFRLAFPRADVVARLVAARRGSSGGRAEGRQPTRLLAGVGTHPGGGDKRRRRRGHWRDRRGRGGGRGRLRLGGPRRRHARHLSRRTGRERRRSNVTFGRE